MEFQTPGGTLSNQDFKKLMMTPRRPSDETPVPDYLTRKRKKREGMRIDTEDVFAKPQRKAEPTPVAYRRARESRYRDRANERRDGGNPDYLDDNKMLREAGLPEPKKDVAETPLYPTSNKPHVASTPQYTPSYTPVQSAQFATPAPGHSMSVGGTTVTRLSSSTPHVAAAPPFSAAATAAAAAAAAPVPGLLPDDVAEQRNQEIREQIEKSKYLGGDVKHTHLVRGLDFALLQKVRQEITLTAKETEELERKEKQDKGPTEGEAAAKSMAVFQTAVGERLHEMLFNKAPKRLDTFLPGRTFYVIDFDENASGVPVTQYRPKHELDIAADDHHNAGLPPKLVDQIAAVCADRRKGLYGTMRDRKRREREREQEKLRAEEDRRRQQQTRRDEPSKPRQPSVSLPDEDIFPDAGEYQPDAPPVPSGPSLAQKTGAPLFTDLREAKAREEKEALVLKERLKAHAKAFAKTETVASKVVPVDDDADPFQLNDLPVPLAKGRPSAAPAESSRHAKGHLGAAPAGDYEECYPETKLDDDDAVYDDMEADDKPAAGGHRRSQKRKRRTDFDTEEEWNRYNSSRAAASTTGPPDARQARAESRTGHRRTGAGGDD